MSARYPPSGRTNPLRGSVVSSAGPRNSSNELLATGLGVFVALVVQIIGAQLGYRSIEVLLGLVVGGAVAARSAGARDLEAIPGRRPVGGRGPAPGWFDPDRHRVLT